MHHCARVAEQFVSLDVRTGTIAPRISLPKARPVGSRSAVGMLNDQAGMEESPVKLNTPGAYGGCPHRNTARPLGEIKTSAHCRSARTQELSRSSTKPNNLGVGQTQLAVSGGVCLVVVRLVYVYVGPRDTDQFCRPRDMGSSPSLCNPLPCQHAVRAARIVYAARGHGGPVGVPRSRGDAVHGGTKEARGQS
jgi:hypothetical protein